MASKPKSPSKSSAVPTPPAGASGAGLRPVVLNLIRLFGFTAMGISAYLAYVSMTGERIVGCGPDSGCEQVLKSKWAYWLNVPVSVFALMTYSMLIGATFRLGLKREAKVHRTTWAWLIGIATLILGAAIWFVSLQGLVVKAFCPFCMAAHACGAIAALLVVVNAPVRSPSAKPWELDRLIFLAPRTVRRVVVLALFALTTLIFGQVKFEPKTMFVMPAPGVTNSPKAVLASNAVAPVAVAVATNAPASAVPTSNETRSATTPVSPVAASLGRALEIYGGKFQLDSLALPTMGAPTNQHLIVSLFDYTCHHCRIMHPVLAEAQQRFSNQLAIISLPMPLDPDCNVTMSRPHPSHTNACAYARLSLGVWRADRAQHAAFDHWLMEGEKPPPIEFAIQKAAEMVTPEKLTKAMSDGWVEAQLKTNVAIYEVAYRAGRGQMPQLVVGQSVALGTYALPELLKLLDDSLGLKAAQ